MPFSRISSIISLIPLVIPIALAIPKIRQLNTNVRTTTIVSSSTTTFLAISTEYSTPATYPATSATPPPIGPPWAMKPWYPPTYTWKAETSGTTSFFYATPADTSIRYSTLPKRPEYTTHPHSPQPPPPALTHSPQIPGREIHPNWDSRWCLTVRTRIFVDGTPVEIGRCTGSLGENWEFKRSPGRTRIRAAGTNFCLEGEIDSMVKIRMCNDDSPSQDWYVTQDDRFAVTGTGRCLDRLDGGLSPGTQVQTYECIDDNTNQVWTS